MEVKRVDLKQSSGQTLYPLSFTNCIFWVSPAHSNSKQVIRPIVAAWWLPECHHGGAGCRSWAPRAAEWRALPSRFACSAAEDVAAQPAHRPDVIPTRRVL